MFHTHRTRNPGGYCSSIYGFGCLTSFLTKNIDWLWKSPWKAITLSLKDEPSLQKVFTIITLYMKVKYAMQEKIHIWFDILKDKYLKNGKGMHFRTRAITKIPDQTGYIYIWYIPLSLPTDSCVDLEGVPTPLVKRKFIKFS